MGKLPKVTKRRDLIRRLKDLGWSGPYQGVGKHPQYMTKGEDVLQLPNPHSKGRGREIKEWLLKDLLEQAGISHEKWLGEEETDDSTR